MKIMMIIMMTLSSMIMTLKHPLSMGFNLIVMTLILSLTMNLMMKFAWYSYILTLVMLGGMLVLFMYMASIASNEMMKFSLKVTIFMIFVLIMSIMLTNNEMIMFSNETMMNIENKQNMSMMKLFYGKTSMTTIMMALYLLMTMIYIIYITNSFEGPMRKKS
uniref:NADH-ubiquinone oxidoreductase chain 6 n=1 Tax=Ventidius distanti TaxID=3095939 RepID=A0AB38Z667_9HEMI|nr:NADH dehydrogenase subunit 6 [Ventidius distanti]WPW46876.1 NADH dehydrogenase subunit 6 [Ventidius distanti]